jgi:chromosome segregation protein
MFTLLLARERSLMRLKRLEIVGFKSFADPFRIDFRGGISAIVGPNGCGKSNIADAVRWVLGNQSPRQLRADRMESVIFSGSSKRKQLGMAEVILTFDNTDRLLGLDYDEVSVSRRLFRTGDSEYSINGSRCRLMDITDLVVDKGLGSTGYWILEAKMVGIILSSRPEDRRFLFDEAAGIVKYKIQRHRAELKLNSAANDLERLSDIIMEVQSTCNGLKRQVSAFNRHKKISDTVKAVTEAINHIESSEIKAELQEKKKLLDETSSVVGRETAALSSGSVVLAETRMEFGRVQIRLDENHKKCADLDSKLASGDREAAVTGERINSAETRIAENNARMAVERERIHRYTSDIEKFKDEQSQLQSSSIALEEKQRVSAHTLEDLKKKHEQAESDLLKARSVRVAVDSRLEDMRQSFRERIRVEESRLQKLSMLTQSLEKNTQAEKALADSISSSKARLFKLGEKNSFIKAELQVKQAVQTELFSAIAEINSALSGSGQSVAVLRDQVNRTTRLLEVSHATDSISSIIKPLPGMGKAIGAYLDSFNSARPADVIPQNSSDGDRFVLPARNYEGELPSGAVALSQCVEKTENSGLTNQVLSHGVLAPDGETAKRWTEEGFHLTVVTAHGDIFRPDGMVRLGIASSGAGSLELADMLKDLEVRLQEAEKKHTELVAFLEKRKQELSVNTDEMNSIRENLSFNEKELTAIGTTLESQEKELESVVNTVTALRQELSDLKNPGMEGTAAEAEDSIAALEKQRAQAAAHEEQAQGLVSIISASVNEAERDQNNCSFSTRENVNRQKEVAGRIKLLTGEAESLQGLLSELQRENEKLSDSISVMRDRQKVIQEESTELKAARSTEEIRRNDCSRERNTLMESTAVLEKEVQRTRDRLGKAKTLMIELEAQTSSLQEKLKDTEDKCTVEDNPFTGKSLEELAGELASGNASLERIGPVNMLAVSEYEESMERLDYLTDQRDDLERARASLERAISEINSEAASRFQETFRKVRDNFQKMFVKLFDGGEGDIVSVESDDPLEGGIEILARPKGKKLKNVLALSAGEKALTAVALLFSLYLVKPSPFCVLDELDSPFDDSNTDKFVSILREFSNNTQFIVITHNKRTMEGSDVLYGITMAEEGVSTITSVNLEEVAQN